MICQTETLTDRQIDRQIDSYKIQLLRGIAIIAVVFIHNTPGGISQVLFRPFLNFCVGLFLFLSGLLSTATNWNPQKRIKKVIVPYVLWSFVYAVLHNIKQITYIPKTFVKYCLLANAAAPMYFIFVYCEFTLLIPLIGKLAKSKYRYWGFLIAPLEIIIFRLIPMITGLELNQYIGMIRSVSCLGWFTYFYLGYMIRNGYVKIKLSTLKLFVLWGSSIALQIVEGYWYYKMGETNCGTQLKLTAILSGTLFALLSYKFIISEKCVSAAFLKKLGDASFGIMFSHMAVMTVLRLIPQYSSYVVYPINAIVAIGVSYLCVKIGKRILGKYGYLLAL